MRSGFVRVFLTPPPRSAGQLVGVGRGFRGGEDAGTNDFFCPNPTFGVELVGGGRGGVGERAGEQVGAESEVELAKIGMGGEEGGDRGDGGEEDGSEVGVRGEVWEAEREWFD